MDKKPNAPISSSGMEIPDYAIERITRCMLPVIREYYKSDECKQELEKWQESQASSDSK